MTTVTYEVREDARVRLDLGTAKTVEKRLLQNIKMAQLMTTEPQAQGGRKGGKL